VKTVPPFEAAIAALAAALREAGAPFMLIGGIAVIARGVARVTTDVDATIRAAGLNVEELAHILERHGIVGRIPDLIAFAQAQQVLLLRHEATGTPIEVSLAWLPFEEEALARAEELDLVAGSVPVALAEDLVVYKAVAWRERDRADVERLLTQHGDRIDLARVRRIVQEFAEALGMPERIAELDAVIRRARGSD
jgi:predicted nucleotidyltransferase